MEGPYDRGYQVLFWKHVPEYNQEDAYAFCIIYPCDSSYRVHDKDSRAQREKSKRCLLMERTVLCIVDTCTARSPDCRGNPLVMDMIVLFIVPLCDGTNHKLSIIKLTTKLLCAKNMW